MSTEKLSARDVFLQLLSIILLYLVAINVGVLMFQLVNVFVPDPLTEGHYVLQALKDRLRFAVATLVVAFPAYLWVVRFLDRELTRLPEKRELRTRRWLLNFTLFATALVILSDLISLVFNFLRGELTVRFALKIAVILFIATTIFTVYIALLRKGTFAAAGTRMLLFARAVAALVGVLTVVGIFVAGLPQSRRLERFDEHKIEELSSIQSQIVNYWILHEGLPDSLSALNDPLTGYTVPRDAQTAVEYEYRVIDPLTFELCAIFNLSSDARVVGPLRGIPKPAMPVSTPDEFYYNEYLSNWKHEKGRNCFERKIDPARFKPPR